MISVWFAEAPSLFNIAHVFGGKLPGNRASLVAQQVVEIPSREIVLPFPKPHRPRRKAMAGSRELTVAALDRNETDEVEREARLEPKAR